MNFRSPPTPSTACRRSARAQNFPISGLAPPRAVRGRAGVDQEGGRAHPQETGRLDARRADAIVAAADEVLAGQHRDQFVVDPYQAGAGTSHNMNVNEVLANRANELLGGARGTYVPVHPNDHVNMAQSTNDTIPTNIRLAVLAAIAGAPVGRVGVARHAGRQGPGVRRHREGGPHAPAGRHADPARTGVRRLRGHAGSLPSAHCRGGRLPQ